MKENGQDVVWGNCINLSGLYSTKPIKCIKDNEFEHDIDRTIYWDKSGTFDIEVVGLDKKKGCIKFSSFDKKETEVWTDGAKSILFMLNNWSSCK